MVKAKKNKKRFHAGQKIFLWEGPPPGYNASYQQDFPNIRVYLVKSKQPTPGVIICPGGGYTHLAEHEGEPIARWLNKIGISAFVLQYRLAPYRYPLPYADIRRAIAHVRFNAPRYNLQSNPIGVMGFSAGAHLCACSGVLFDNGILDDTEPEERMSNRPDFMILGYPVVSFIQKTHQGSIHALLGESPSLEEKSDVSIEKLIREDTPPTFVFHTEEDPAVDISHTVALVAALREKGVSVESHCFSNRPQHGVGLAENDKKLGLWTTLCEAWLEETVDQLKPTL
jgi:acetyl esterase/lipase